MNRYIEGNPASNLITTHLNETFRGSIAGSGGAQLIKQSTENYRAQSIHHVSMSNSGGLDHNNLKQAAADYKKSMPSVQDPRTTFLSLQVPENRKLLNALYRYYDATDPIIQNSHRLHTEFPLANMTLSHCGDPAIQRHFEDMWYDRIQGPSFLLDMGIEYNRLGNVITFGAWNMSDLMWDKIAILNPDYVEIEDTWLAQRPLIKLQPDETLKRIINTQKPYSLFKQLHPEIIRYVRMNKEIPLDPANVWHIAYNKAPYGVWGDPPVKSLLKILFYESKLTEAQVAIAYRHIVPITLVKVGSETSGWIPSQEELDDVQSILAAREMDPNMSIIYHYGLNIEYIGASGKTLPVDAEFTRIDELKLMGLGVSKAFLGGENGPTYSNASVSLAVLKQRYMHMTQKFSQFITHGLFQPVADACGFYRKRQTVVGYAGATRYKYGDICKEAESYRKDFDALTLRDIKDNVEFKDYLISKATEALKKTARDSIDYIIPAPNWSLMNLAGDLDWRRWLTEYNQYFIETDGIPVVSESTIYQMLQLDEEAERKNIIRELREKKVRTERLQAEGIIPPPKPAQAGLGDMVGGFGGGGSLPPLDMGGGEDMGEGNFGPPGEMDSTLPVGGTVGNPELPEIPAGAASTNKQYKKLGFASDAVVDLLEQEINEILADEL